ncbi:DUF3320 domain-containing protein [Methylocystis parvus]|uniref:DUF3320 domain-containing protein n=1 Tax=Methylocystis parvus TaxID=134 RepID=UPI003C7205B0
MMIGTPSPIDQISPDHGEAQAPSVELSYSASDHVNVAFFQNAIPIIRGISVTNNLADDLSDVTVSFSSEPPFIAPRFVTISRIRSGSQHHLPAPDLKLDQTYLSGLTASRRSEILVRIRRGEEVLVELSKEVNLLPPGFWGGSQSSPELLAAFVRPTDPSVDVILRDAAEKLKKSGKETAFDGYRSGKKGRAWEMADAIWAAMVGYAITYVYPPASFEKLGQLIRGPSEILDRKVGTCLDLALTYASCLEQAGLHPVLVLTEGHALVGVWLTDTDFSTVVVDDPQMLRKRIQLDELILVESTYLTGNPPGRFKQAIAQGHTLVAEGLDGKFEIAIDVNRARLHQIRPLDLGGNARPVQSPDVAEGADFGLEATPIFEEDITPPPPAATGTQDRLEVWKARLLDLSLKNRLLNFKEGKTAIHIACCDLGGLEDHLSSGKAFKIRHRVSVVGEDGRDVALLRERLKDDAYRMYIDEAMKRLELHADVTEDQLDTRLTELYRAARTAFEEGGSNILFLSAGFLKWTPAGRDSTYKAPLLLIPVRLERKSVRSGFQLLLHEDEIRFNPTLLHMLRQDFHMAIPEIETGLPVDGSGVDVAKILRAMKDRVKDVRGWEVTEELVLSTVSFTKYLMWKDLIDRTEELKRNDVVRHLIDTPKYAYEKGEPFISPREIDHAVEPAQIFMPLSADSSQTAAVVAAARGKDFVLFGPPGTGKSQTITNMIATCLAHGRTVLFVSQKTAALEVVQRRLSDIGLGGYCVEVHSSKAQKSRVVEQLKNAWKERQAATEQDWVAANDELKTRRDELNGMVSALHRRRENGMSAFEAFSRVVADRDRFPEITLGWPRTTRHGVGELQRLRTCVQSIKMALQAIGSSYGHALSGIKQTRWTPAWREDFLTAVEGYRVALERFRGAAGALGETVALPADYWDQGGIIPLVNFVKALTAPEASDGALLLGENPERLLQAMAAVERLVGEASALRRRLNGNYDPRVLKVNLVELQKEWTAAAASNFLVRSGRKESVRLKLKPFCDDVPEDISSDLVVLENLAAFALKAEDYGTILGDCAFWRGLNTEVFKFPALSEWHEKTLAHITKLTSHTGLDFSSIRTHAYNLLTAYGHIFIESGPVRTALGGFRDAHADLNAAAEKLAALAGLAREDLLVIGPTWIDDYLQTASRWVAGIVDAPAWCRWRAAVAEADATGLQPLVKAIDEGEIASGELEAVFEYSYAGWWANCVANDDEVVSSFLVEDHENKIEAFVKADQRVAELSKQIIRARISGGVPSMTGFGNDPEWGTLSREIQRTKLPLRQLFDQIPTVLAKLAPCMMMSPLSIAQYLPADAKPFDVVIVDEASQIPVWDAVGALARGNQVIVVGDPEQLPPTNVGERGNEDADDDTVADLPSILDECLGANIPHLELTWHYRSRHESLIAFSNAKYYRGQLVTFPSAVTKDTAVSFIHVPDGTYERGSGRVNRREAEMLVSHLLERLRTSPHSLGVVTFNSEQQRLIENLLDQARMADPTLEPFFDPARSREPVIVKNLENVQGDERDVILFSVAVGPDRAGVVRAQISSLNKQGGHRRLNVAVTRARRELTVFASMKPAQIDLGRTNARGVRDFKHFLEFAERGPKAMAEAFEMTGRPTESPFEDAVKAALERRGWEVHPQIGVSFFRVDLGIVHPDEPGRYLAGVECDGAAYHSSATARDRDRLREIVLKDLGWNIRRIWSTDWWMNPHLSLDRIDNKLREDLAADREHKAAEEAARQVELNKQQREQEEWAAAEAAEEQLINAASPAKDSPEGHEPQWNILPVPRQTASEQQAHGSVPKNIYAEPRAPQQGPVQIDFAPGIYRVADLREIASPDQGRFYDPGYRGVLAAMAEHVIQTEGPVFKELVIARIREAHGFQRARDQIRDIITRAIGDRFNVTEESDGRIVLWPRHLSPQSMAPWRSLGGRSHVDVPLAELASLAAACDGGGFDDEEIVRAMQDHFQLGRLRGPTRDRFEEAVKQMRLACLN